MRQKELVNGQQEIIWLSAETTVYNNLFDFQVEYNHCAAVTMMYCFILVYCVCVFVCVKCSRIVYDCTT